MSNVLRATEITPRTAFFSIGALVLVTVGTVFGVKSFLAGPSTPPAVIVKEQTAKENGTTLTVTANGKATETGNDQRTYAVITQRNLFAPVIKPPAPVTPPVKATVKPPPVAPRNRVPPVMPSHPMTPSIDTKNIAFTGIVTLPSGTYALLEELSTQKTEYVLVGGSAFNFRVASLVDKTVTLEQNGQMATLALGDHKPDAPAGTASPAATPNSGSTQTAPAPVTDQPTDTNTGGDRPRRFGRRRMRTDNGGAPADGNSGGSSRAAPSTITPPGMGGPTQ